MMMKKVFAAAAACLFMSLTASAQIYITEWMYDGEDGEFIELTNVGGTAIDLTGWSYNDENREDGTFDLSPFGVVAPGQSVILTDGPAEEFRAAWGLDASVLILSGYDNKLGRDDEINIYNAEGGLADRLTYDDENEELGGPRTKEVSGNIPHAALGLNNAYVAVESFAGDAWGSYTSSGGDIANPGAYVPEPATFVIMLMGLAVSVQRRKRIKI